MKNIDIYIYIENGKYCEIWGEKTLIVIIFYDYDEWIMCKIKGSMECQENNYLRTLGIWSRN